MRLKIDDLGVVGIIVDDWSFEKSFKPKTIVTDYRNWRTYISRRAVPKHIELTDSYYWKPILKPFGGGSGDAFTRIKVGNNTLVAVGEDEFELIAGDNVTIEADTESKTITINAEGEKQVQSDWRQSNVNAVDYIKNKPNIPAAQIQSDWEQTDTSSKDYIKNKPVIDSQLDYDSKNAVENSVIAYKFEDYYPKNKVWRKDESYNKTEINNIISNTPETEVILVDANALVALEQIPVSTENGYFDISGDVTQGADNTIKVYEVNEGTIYYFDGSFPAQQTALPFVGWYDENNNFIKVESYVGSTSVATQYNRQIITAPASAAYLYLNTDNSIGVGDVYMKDDDAIIDIPAILDVLFPDNVDPVTGLSTRARKLYRVPGPANTSFSEWAWDGNTWIMLCNKDYGIDEEIDVFSQNIPSTKSIAETFTEYIPKLNTKSYAGYLKNDTTNKVVFAGTSHPLQHSSLVIPLVGNEKVELGYPENPYTLYVFTKDFNYPNFTVVDWMDNRGTISANSKVEFDLSDGSHDDARYLIVTVLTSNIDVSPNLFKINGLDYNTDIATRVRTLENNTDSIDEDVKTLKNTVGEGYNENLRFDVYQIRTYGTVGQTANYFLKTGEKVTYHIYSMATSETANDRRVYFMASTVAYKGMYDTDTANVIYAKKHEEADLGRMTLYEGEWVAPVDCYIKFKGLIPDEDHPRYDSNATTYISITSLLAGKSDSYGYLNSFYLSYVGIDGSNNVVPAEKPLVILSDDDVEYNLSKGFVVQFNRGLHLMYYNSAEHSRYEYKNVGAQRYSKSGNDYIVDPDGEYARFLFEGNQVYAKVIGDRYTKIGNIYVEDASGEYVKITCPVLNEGLRLAYTLDGFNWTKGYPDGMARPAGVVGNELLPIDVNEAIIDEVYTKSYSQQSYHGPAVVKVNDIAYPYRMIVNKGTAATNYTVVMFKSVDGVSFVNETEISSLHHDAPFSAIAYGNIIKVYLRMWVSGLPTKDRRQVGVLFIDLEGNIVSSATTLFGPGLYNSAATRIDDRRELLFPTLTDLTPGVDKCWYTSYFVNGDNVIEGPNVNDILKVFGEGSDWNYSNDPDELECIWGWVNPGFVLVDGDVYLTYIQRNNSHGYTEDGQFERRINPSDYGKQLRTEVRLVQLTWKRVGWGYKT